MNQQLRSWLYPATTGIGVGCLFITFHGTIGPLIHRVHDSIAPITRGKSVYAQGTNTTLGSQNSLGNSLYRRTLRAEHAVPVSARVETTEWGKSSTQRLVFDIVEGTDNRYRMEYLQPEPVRGRVLVSDGRNLYQYEPNRNLVIRRTLQSLPEMTAESAQYLQSSTFEVQNASVQVAGRSTRIVVRRFASTGMIRERRWIDTETFRTLRHEQFDLDGVLKRLLEYRTVSYSETRDQSVFFPRFPASARVLTGNRNVKAVTAITSEQFNLPRHAKGFHFQSALKTPKTLGTSIKPAVTDGHQLIYSDGVRVISIFVSSFPASVSSDSWRPGGKWSTIKGEANTVLTCTDSITERTAVAWINDSKRYIAVSRMPLVHLMTVVQALRPRN